MKSKKIVLAFVLSLILLGNVFAQDPPPEPSNNFRINVITEKDAYISGGRLSLVVELLNNSPRPVRIVMPEPNQPPQNEEPNETVLRRHVIIGMARLIPLHRPQIPDGNTAESAPEPVKQVPLRLLGGPLITGHSTVVISAETMLLGFMPIPGTDESAIDEDVADSEEIDLIGLRPGLYLLDCEVRRIAGVQEAHAEKIIRVLPKPKRHDNGRRPNPNPTPTSNSNTKGK